MTLTLLYIWMMAAVFAGVSLIGLRLQGRSQAMQRHALALIECLRGLLESIPQHRGMANAFLRGDAGFKVGMEKMQRTVTHDIDRLRRICLETGSAHLSAAIDRLSLYWQQLATGVFDMQAASSFDQHTRLIEQIIRLMEEATDDFGLRSSDDMVTVYSINTLTLIVPVLAETLGQARGIGTGAAVKGECDIGTRVKLKYLQKTILEVLGHKLSTPPAGMHEINPHIEFAAGCTRKFLQVLSREMIESRRICIAPDAYYAHATDAIAANFRLFDMILPKFAGLMDHGMAMAHRAGRIRKSGSMLLLIFAGIMVWLTFTGLQ